MVHETYDHIAAILVVGLIFIGAVLVLPNMSFTKLQSVDYQQLKNTALNVFNAMLLDTGEPSDWGSKENWSPDIVTRFGLASSDSSKFYVLDPDKVQRLKSGNPLGEINNDDVKELLALEGYDFNLRIIPPFNVTNLNGSKIDPDHSPINESQLNQGICQYVIKVAYLDGRPIVNADVQGLALYTNGDGFNQTSIEVKQTNSLGICGDSIELALIPTQIIVILKIDVADVASLVVTLGKDTSDVVNINMVGDNIVLTRPENNPTGATIFLNGIYVFNDQGMVELFEDFSSKEKFTYTKSGPYEEWVGTFPQVKSYQPTLVIISYDNTEGKGGRQDFVVAGPYQNLLGYSIFEYGSPTSVNGPKIILQRSVLISGMTYTAELTFWKQS